MSKCKNSYNCSEKHMKHNLDGNQTNIIKLHVLAMTAVSKCNSANTTDTVRIFQMRYPICAHYKAPFTHNHKSVQMSEFNLSSKG